MHSIEKARQTMLPQLDEAKLESLVNELVKVGVEGPDDLQFIQEDDIKHLHTHSVQKDSSLRLQLF